MTNLEFRWLLSQLYQLGNDRHPYNAIQIAENLRIIHHSDPSVQRLATTKKISNDLDRLYRMGFLSRKRRKRLVTTRNGKTCYRGFVYFYYITKQGISYSSYLRKSLLNRNLDQMTSHKLTVLKEPYSHFIMNELKPRVDPGDSVTLPKIAEYFLPLFSKNPFGGRYKRFPPKRDYELFAMMATLLARNKAGKKLIVALCSTIDIFLEEAQYDEKTLDKVLALAEDAIK